MLRAYIDHGVENPALYSLMFGGYLGGPDHGRPAIELAEAEKTKALLAGVIIAGGSGTRYPAHLAQRTKDRRRDSGVLVPRAWTHSAAGRRARRPEEKVWRAGDSLVQGMLDGLATELPTLPPGTWVGPQAPNR